MSKLDDILSPEPDTAAGQSIRFIPDPIKKQRIKDLMLELVRNEYHYQDSADDLLAKIVKKVEAL